MKKFEEGKTYYSTSPCDHNCIFILKIVTRTEKTVTFIQEDKKRRTKLHSDQNGEFIIPDRYSMAPVYRAENVYGISSPSLPEKNTQTKLDDASTLHQPPSGLQTIQRGQRVYRNCGAMYPIEWGTVISCEQLPETSFSRGGAYAAIRWDGNVDDPDEKVKIDSIHPHGWRSENGSPIGIFCAKIMLI